MKCPACNTPSLSLHDLEKDLQSYKCNHCEGYWISGHHYWQWLKGQPGRDCHPAGENTDTLPITDSTQAKICIECGHLMIRSKVGHGLDFFLDRCSTCGGTWFDKNEWAALKSYNLHDEIHSIFSAVWQSENRKMEQRSTHEKALLAILGEQDFRNLKELKSWIGNHPKKSWLVAFLLND